MLSNIIMEDNKKKQKKTSFNSDALTFDNRKSDLNNF